MTMRSWLTFIFVAVLVFAACKQPSSASVVDVDQLGDTYAELIALNERYSVSKDTASRQAYMTEYQQILQQHHLTKEEYASQFLETTANASLYRQLCDRALTRLQTMKTKPDTARTRG